jgi:hypothetical protein
MLLGLVAGWEGGGDLRGGRELSVRSYQLSVISLGCIELSVKELSVISLGSVSLSVISLGFDFGVAIAVEAAIHRASYRNGNWVFTGHMHHFDYQYVPGSGINDQSACLSAINLMGSMTIYQPGC